MIADSIIQVKSPGKSGIDRHASNLSPPPPRSSGKCEKFQKRENKWFKYEGVIDHANL